jgi:hypothetical protein
MMRVLLTALQMLALSLLAADQAIPRSMRLGPRPSATFSGLIAAARQAGGSTSTPNTYWQATGVQGGIPYTLTKCGTTLASSSTAAQINTAITNCSSGYVELGPGTFSLSSKVILKSNVVLRGQGMSTILNFTGTGGTGWYWAGGACTVVMAGNYPEASDASPSIASVPSGTIKTWSGTNGVAGTFTQGATVVNLSSTTGLSVGDMLVLYQDDELDSAVPSSGFFVSEDISSSLNSAVTWQGSYDDHGAAMQQRASVTAINGTAVTISPGLIHPTGAWQTARNPKAGWLTASRTIQNAGLEDLRVVTSGIAGGLQCGIGIAWAKNVWVTRVGLVPRFGTHQSGNTTDFGIVVNDSMWVSVTNNWLDKMIGGGIDTTTSYGVALRGTQHSRVENNIFNNVESPSELLIASGGNVYAHNYERFVGDDQQEGGIQQHEVGSMLNLVEGNTYYKMFGDVFHGNTALSTYFRNYLTTRGFDLWSYHRWYNLIGNTIGATTVRKTLVTDSTRYDRYASYAFRLGYPQDSNANTAAPVDVPNLVLGSVGPDSVVGSSAMLWGNYATIGGTVFDSSEVPSSDPTFPNPVPASQTLPTSLYSSSRPPYFVVNGVGTRPWPLNGPEITGGDFLAGHANKTAAQKLYEATASASIANFNPWRYGQPAGSLSFGTIFPAAENPISEGAVWINGGTTGLDWSNCSTTPNFIRGQQIPDGTHPFNDSTCLLAGSWGNDQRVDAVVVNNNTDPDAVIEVEIRLRSEVTAHSNTGYEVYWSVQQNNNYCTIARWNGPLDDYVNLADCSSPTTIVTGDVLRADIVGSVITVYRNGVSQLTYNTAASAVTDPPATRWATGKPGLGFFLLNNAGDPALQSSYGFSQVRVATR